MHLGTQIHSTHTLIHSVKTYRLTHMHTVMCSHTVRNIATQPTYIHYLQSKTVAHIYSLYSVTQTHMCRHTHIPPNLVHTCTFPGRKKMGQFGLQSIQNRP